MLVARLHSSLYERDAVEAAVRAFGAHQVELTEEGEYWLARISTDGDGRALVGEFANFALGLTIERRVQR